MKGFIEVTEIYLNSLFTLVEGGKRIINVLCIKEIHSSGAISTTDGERILTKESYEEIKQLIKEAQK